MELVVLIICFFAFVIIGIVKEVDHGLVTNLVSAFIGYFFGRKLGGNNEKLP